MRATLRARVLQPEPAGASALAAGPAERLGRPGPLRISTLLVAASLAVHVSAGALLMLLPPSLRLQDAPSPPGVPLLFEAAAVPVAPAAPAPPPTPSPVQASPEPVPEAPVPMPPPADAPLPKPPPAATGAPKPPASHPAPARPAAPAGPKPQPPTQPSAPAATAPVASATIEPARPLAAGAGNALPAYPESARRRRIQGHVLLDVAVTEDGRAGAVSVRQSSGSALLDEAALAAVRGWKFVPATRGGAAVAGHADVPVDFHLDATAAGAP